jgi:hypothetical protein
MGRRSTITQLDEPLQAEVNRLVRSGWTIDDIKAQLATLGAEVSRSAMGRYVKTARESMERYRDAQEVSKVWLEKLESEKNGDVARLLPQMLSGIAFATLDSMGASDDNAKPMDLMLLAKALKDLSGTTKVNLDTELLLRKARAQAAQEALDAAAKNVGEAARAQGMSETEADFWMKKVLGVAS